MFEMIYTVKNFNLWFMQVVGDKKVIALAHASSEKFENGSRNDDTRALIIAASILLAHLILSGW